MDSASVSTRLEGIRLYCKRLKFTSLLTLLFGLSFLVHLSVALAFIDQPIALDDMFQYDMLARSLKDGNGYRWYSQADVEVLRPYYAQFLDIDHLPFPPDGIQTTFRAPGYPFFLAFLYLLAPEAYRFVLARLAQAGLAALLAPLAAILAHQAGLGRKAGFLAGIGVSFYPILLAYPLGLASEDLYILLGIASLAAVIHSLKTGSWKWTLLASGLCGLTMLTRSIFAGYVVLAGVWIGRRSTKGWRAGLVFGLAAFGLCLPWSIRNSILMHKPSFVENSLGYNLFIGYNPAGDGGFISKIAIQPMNILDDGQRDRYCMQQALLFIRQNPLEAARRILVRLVKFLGPEDREFFYFYSNDLLGSISQTWLGLIYLLLVFPWLATLLLGLAGLWFCRKREIAMLTALYLLGYGLPHWFIIAEPRFHLAWAPVLLPFAAYGFQAVRAWPWRRQLKQNWALVAVLIFVLCIFIAGMAADYPKLAAIMGAGGNTLYYSY